MVLSQHHSALPHRSGMAVTVRPHGAGDGGSVSEEHVAAAANLRTGQRPHARLPERRSTKSLDADGPVQRSPKNPRMTSTMTTSPTM